MSIFFEHFFFFLKDLSFSIEFYKKNLHLNGHNLVMMTTKTVGHDIFYQLSQVPAYKNYEQPSRNYTTETRTVAIWNHKKTSFWF